MTVFRPLPPARATIHAARARLRAGDYSAYMRAMAHAIDTAEDPGPYLDALRRDGFGCIATH